MYDYPKLVWWIAVPVNDRGRLEECHLETSRLTSTPFRRWSDILSYNGDDVLFFAEDDNGSGLIETRARIATLDSRLFVVFDNQFYELEPATMISDRMLELTEGVPTPVLYTIRLSKHETGEDDLIVITGDSYIHDAEVFPEEIGSLSDGLKRSIVYTRDFYRLVPRPTT